MAKKKRKPAKRKKPAKKRSGGKSLFKIASRNKGFAAAKRASVKAAARKKRAWKKALVIAKRKLRKMR